MADECEVTKVEESQLVGDPAWLLHIRMPDGRFLGHMIPKFAVVARGIEFGLDPETQTSEILDMILHEPAIPDVDPEDPAAAEGYVTTDKDGKTVVANLWLAETIKDAREARQLRVAKVKRDRMRVSVQQHVMEKIRKDTVEDRKAVRRGKKDHPSLVGLEENVRAIRQQQRGRKDGKPLKG